MEEAAMKRRNLVLAGLAAGGGAIHTPVQIQKLFFLIDKNISKLVDGPHFNFKPYNYGPFDSDVYREIEGLASEGFVELVREDSWASYVLTTSGQEEGTKILDSLPDKAKDYIKRASQFVRSLPFTQLVSAIYKAYPEMQENSVFQK